MSETTVPPEAVEAAADALHDEECDAGTTLTCPRFRSPAGAGHREFYRQLAALALEAAAPAIVSAARLAHAHEHADITAQAVRTERNRILNVVDEWQNVHMQACNTLTATTLERLAQWIRAAP